MFARFILVVLLALVAGNAAAATDAPGSAKHRGSGRISAPVIIAR